MSNTLCKPLLIFSNCDDLLFSVQMNDAFGLLNAWISAEELDAVWRDATDRV